MKRKSDTKTLSGKTSNMVPNDCVNYDHIETLVLSKLANILDVSKFGKEQDGYYIIDTKNNFGFGCDGTDVIIFYAGEHHDIMGMDFANMDAWASEVCRFLGLFINKMIRFEYYFHSKKQIRFKLYSIDGDKEELIENVITTFNQFLFKESKAQRKEMKLIEFKQQ